MTFSGGAVTGTVNVDLPPPRRASARAARTMRPWTSTPPAPSADELNFSIALNGGAATMSRGGHAVPRTSPSRRRRRGDEPHGGRYTTPSRMPNSSSILNNGIRRRRHADRDHGKRRWHRRLPRIRSSSRPTSQLAATSGSVAVIAITVAGPVVATQLRLWRHGRGGTASVANVTASTVDQLVTAINANASLTGKVKATNDGGKVSIQNLSTEDLTVVGATAARRHQWRHRRGQHHDDRRQHRPQEPDHAVQRSAHSARQARG